MEGKKSLDQCMMKLGRTLAETFMYMEREEQSGRDYHPTDSQRQKWGSQKGSIYLGNFTATPPEENEKNSLLCHRLVKLKNFPFQILNLFVNVGPNSSVRSTK